MVRTNHKIKNVYSSYDKEKLSFITHGVRKRTEFHFHGPCVGLTYDLSMRKKLIEWFDRIKDDVPLKLTPKFIRVAYPINFEIVCIHFGGGNRNLKLQTAESWYRALRVLGLPRSKCDKINRINLYINESFLINSDSIKVVNDLVNWVGGDLIHRNDYELTERYVKDNDLIKYDLVKKIFKKISFSVWYLFLRSVGFTTERISSIKVSEKVLMLRQKPEAQPIIKWFNGNRLGERLPINLTKSKIRHEFPEKYSQMMKIFGNYGVALRVCGVPDDKILKIIDEEAKIKSPERTYNRRREFAVIIAKVLGGEIDPKLIEDILNSGVKIDY